jgi:endonuclease YncB( thermonuclease family)
VQRYFLSNFRAPALGNHKKQEVDKPYAFEAKEALRKLAIGKKVNVHVDYVRKPQVKEENK